LPALVQIDAASRTIFAKMEMMFFFSIALIEDPIGDKHVDTYKKYIKYFIPKNQKNLIF